MENKKRVLINCDINEHKSLCSELIHMTNDWINHHKLTCMSTTIGDIENIHEWDKIVFIKTTNDNNIKEYKFEELSENRYQLKIKGFGQDKLSDNGKLNMEQSFQFLTRQLAGWALIKKNLPIHFLQDI